MTISGAPTRVANPSLRRGSRYFLSGQLILFLAIVTTGIVALAADPNIIGNAGSAVAAVASAFGVALTLSVQWPQLPSWMRIIVPAVNFVAVISLAVVTHASTVLAILIIPIIEISLRLGIVGAAIGILGFMGASAIVALLDGTGMAALNENFFLAILIISVAALIVAGLAEQNDSMWELVTAQSKRAETLTIDARNDRRILDLVLNTITVGVISLDKSGRPLVINAWQRGLYRAATGITRIHHVTDLDLNVVERDGVTPIPADQHPLTRALAGETFTGVVVWLHTEGGLLALSITARQVYTVDGERDGTVILTQDVTDSVNALAARDLLVASVSHELRTPLTSIIGYLEMVDETDDLSDEVRDWVAHASSGAERLLELVSDLLLAASLESGRFVLAKRPIDLTQLVGEAIDFLGPQAEQRGITLVTSGISTPVIIDADAQRMRQVIDNLLSNAIKYSPDGTQVTITETVSGESVSVRIADQGTGMTPEDVAHATDRFYRSPTARKSGVDGTGLGLHISNAVVSQHGGKLSIESAPGVGTTVTVTVPRIGRVAPVIPVAVAGQINEVKP